MNPTSIAETTGNLLLNRARSPLSDLAMVVRQDLVEATLRKAFEKTAQDIRRLNPKEKPESYTEADFQCLMYYNLLDMLGKKMAKLLQAEEPFDLKVPNPLGKKVVKVDITLGTASGRTNVLVEIKPFFGHTLEDWDKHSKERNRDVRKLRFIICQYRETTTDDEEFPATLRGFVVVPLLGKTSRDFDTRIIERAEALNAKSNEIVSILVA